MTILANEMLARQITLTKICLDLVQLLFFRHDLSHSLHSLNSPYDLCFLLVLLLSPLLFTITLCHPLTKLIPT